MVLVELVELADMVRFSKPWSKHELLVYLTLMHEHFSSVFKTMVQI